MKDMKDEETLAEASANCCVGMTAGCRKSVFDQFTPSSDTA